MTSTSFKVVCARVVSSALMMLTPWIAVLGQGGPPRGEHPRGLSERQRTAMEAQFQDRLNAIVRARLQLSDEQYARLRVVASRSEAVRRTLRRDEMALRTELRREMMSGDSANETRVAELLDGFPRLERRKVQIMEREQLELAQFLSPLQRARYLGVQEELRRGMQELQRRRLERPETRGDSGSRRPFPGPPGAPIPPI